MLSTRFFEVAYLRLQFGRHGYGLNGLGLDLGLKKIFYQHENVKVVMNRRFR